MKVPTWGQALWMKGNRGQSGGDPTRSGAPGRLLVLPLSVMPALPVFQPALRAGFTWFRFVMLFLFACLF